MFLHIVLLLSDRFPRLESRDKYIPAFHLMQPLLRFLYMQYYTTHSPAIVLQLPVLVV
jgi:hypothetical protein